MEVKNLSSSHILWIDGIKGVCCIFIFLHHFFLDMFPSSYYGAARDSRLFGVDTFLSQNPLGIFLNGNFFVFIYIIISGYVITYQIIQKSPFEFGVFHLKRYLKLMFPLLIYCCVFFIIYFINQRSVIVILRNNKCNFYTTIKNGLFRILFFSDISYGGHFWMMKYIFLGGIYVSIIASLISRLNIKFVFFISLLFSFIFLLNLDFCYLAVFLACSYCIFVSFNKNSQIHNKNSKIFNIIYILFIILGIFLGAYPSGYLPDNLYRYLTLPVKPEKSFCFYQLIGAFLIFISIAKLQFIQFFFESKLCLKLAKISYPFYVFHCLILALVKPIFKVLMNLTFNYIFSSL